MPHAALLDLLTHHDADLRRQGVELAVSLSGGERLALAGELVVPPVRPGRSWLALRICAPDLPSADRALRRWHHRCAAEAIRLLPPALVWDGLLTALEQNCAQPCPAFVEAASEAAAEEVRLAQLRRSMRDVTCGRAAICAAAEAAEASRRGGQTAPLLLRRFLPAEQQGWERAALLGLCAQLLSAHSTRRR